MKKLFILLTMLIVGIGSSWAKDVVISDRTNTVATGSVTTTNEHKYGTYSNAAGGTTFTTNATSGMAGVTVTADEAMIRAAWFSNTNYLYVMGFNPDDTNNHTITISAPDGYIITGYSITAISTSSNRKFTVTPYGDTPSTDNVSSSLVSFNKTGLSNQTATITIKAANDATGNFLCFPLFSVTVLSATIPTVNVTYELYESDGTTLVNSVVKEQEQNSDIEVPTSLTAPTYYDYSTEGSIGENDCTIKVIRTLKSGYVISLDGLSNSKCYNIRNNRGTWAVGSGATVVNSTVELGLAFLASDTKQQFAFITYEGNVYLYSVGERKFAYVDGTKLSLTADVTSAVEASPITFVASTNATYMYSEPIIVTVNGSHFGISTNYSPDVYKYQSQGDGGNCAYIIEAGSFDPTSALAALEEYFHPSYTVTYKVKDGNNNVLFTSDPVGTTNGANITTLPAEYQLTNFYEYNTVDVTISASGNTDVVFTATPKAEPLVKYTADTSNPYYYNLNIRSKYLVYNSEATGQVTLQSTSEPFNANASWAFIGEPYAGFKVINKAKGTDYFLTYTSVVSGGNGGSDGSNNNVQFVASADFNNRYWIVDTNSGGFCMRMKENTNIYFHHQNIQNATGYLRTCSVAEWGGVHNDAGSTIVASTDEEVLIALYNSMKDYTYGTAIGQYSAEGVTATEANITITQVGAAITNNMTAAYADAYAALNALQAKTSLNTPAAGFYRVKNVATNGYLYATAASGYTSTDRKVYADGSNSGAETIIQLVEHNGHLYMLTQGHEFGWVAQPSTKSGQVGYVRDKAFDKYVNWLPGTAAGQIAFAICFGNGTGNYASYLTQGIYAVDTQDKAVIRGTEDYTANTAQWIFEDVSTLGITLNGPVDDNYYATLCLPFDVTITSGANAYTLEESDGWLVPTAVEDNKVPAGTPVLLKGTSALATATINTASSFNSGSPLDCALTGIYFATTVDTRSTSGNYVFGKNSSEAIGFYHVNNQNFPLKANRAYMNTSASDARGFSLMFDDVVTGIVSTFGETEEGAVIYNISGQRLNKMQKGINIVNGKKVLF
jgi:hypothetical protein